jgi:hypothetical protein
MLLEKIIAGVVIYKGNSPTLNLLHLVSDMFHSKNTARNTYLALS